MIFVTTGSMLPFDRLIEAMDRWASAGPRVPVLAQIGDGANIPAHMRWVRTMSLGEYASALEQASLVVAHAGMGTIISAAELGKPIVILPRLKSQREITTDHQLHTARRLIGKPGIYVAMADTDLPDRISEALASLTRPDGLSRSAPPEFVDRVKRFLTSGNVSPLSALPVPGLPATRLSIERDDRW